MIAKNTQKMLSIKNYIISESIRHPKYQGFVRASASALDDL